MAGIVYKAAVGTVAVGAYRGQSAVVDRGRRAALGIEVVVALVPLLTFSFNVLQIVSIGDKSPRL